MLYFFDTNHMDNFMKNILDNSVVSGIAYALKYLSKDCNVAHRMILGHWYYAGGKGLKREPDYTLHNLDYVTVDAKEYSPTEEGYIKFKYISFEQGENAQAFVEEHDLNTANMDIDSGLGDNRL